jgi:hypothetical protein
MPKWRNEYRRCDNCRGDYRPQREAQSYCSRDCRRAAAYGRERFKAGTKGRRKSRLEASDKLRRTLVAGSFRKGDFSSIKSVDYRPTNWVEKPNQHDVYGIDQAYWTREKRKWPVDLMGGARHNTRRPALTVEPKLRQSIIETEWLLKEDEPNSHCLSGDDIQLEYYEDGYPRLPECLDRRPQTVWPRLRDTRPPLSKHSNSRERRSARGSLLPNRGLPMSHH